jgi:hypothetical protein
MDKPRYPLSPYPHGILGMPRSYTFNLRQVHLLWILPTLPLDYHQGRPSISLSTEPIPFQDFGTNNAGLGPRASDTDDTNSSSTSEPPVDQLSLSMPLSREPDRSHAPWTPPQLMAEYSATMTDYFGRMALPNHGVPSVTRGTIPMPWLPPNSF